MRIPAFGYSALWTASMVRLAAAPSEAGNDGTNVQFGQTVEITSSHARCWFPTIHRFRSGEIMVTMQMAPDQIDAEAELSAYCLSKDGGITWSRRYTMGEEASADGAWSESPDDQDRIWWWGNYPEPQRAGDGRAFFVPLARYSEGGRTVCIERNVELAVKEALYPDWVRLFDYLFDGETPIADSREKVQYSFKAWGDIVVGASGELLSDGYLMASADPLPAGSKSSARFYRNVVLRSDDKGKSWSEFSTIARIPLTGKPSWMGDEGPSEGSIAVLGGHRLYAVYRTGGNGMIGNSWSADDGRTWTNPASIGFQGVAPRVHRLHDGTLVLATGRPGPIVLRFNQDGTGNHWSNPVIVFTGKSTCYSDVLEVAPGKLLVVYDSVPYGWYEIPFADRDTKNRILGAFVTVTKE